MQKHVSDWILGLGLQTLGRWGRGSTDTNGGEVNSSHQSQRVELTRLSVHRLEGLPGVLTPGSRPETGRKVS